MLQGGPLSSEQAITDQEKLQAILKKRIAQMDQELEASGGKGKGTGERIEVTDKVDESEGEKKEDEE
jgi:predicted ArsR family transcriptional regulator